MSRLDRFLSELRRRRVYRAAVVYVVAAVAVVQAAESILPRLGMPDSVVTFILVVGIFGLPLILWMAWIFEFTGDGLRRTAPRDGPVGRGGGYVMPVAVLGIVLLAGWWIVWGRAGARPDDSPDPGLTARSIAVLPFRALTSQADEALLGEGLAEEILGALTGIPGLRVIATESSFALAGRPISEIREAIGVSHVLTGTIRMVGEDVQIEARLLETEGEEVVWQRGFQPERSSYYRTQEQIARAVVNVLEVELGPIGAYALMNAATDNVRAHQEYLRGLRLWNHRSEPDILAAISHFSDAVELDPDYAAAWAGLSLAYLVLPEYSPDADVVRVREASASAAQRALELEPDQVDALTAMGWGRMIHHYDWQGAEDLIARALSLDPTNVNALHWQSHVLSWQGRHDEALELARTAVELSPLSPIMRQNLGFILMEAREYEEALDQYSILDASDPEFGIAKRTVWNINTRLGNLERAADALVEWLTFRGSDASTARQLASEFVDGARSFRTSGTKGGFSPGLVERARLGLEIEGQLLAAVGDADGTLEVLERAYLERAGGRNLLSIRVNPLYDFLRDDPRFLDLLERVGLDD